MKTTPRPYLLAGAFAYETVLPLVNPRSLQHETRQGRKPVNVEVSVPVERCAGTAGQVAYNAALLGDSPLLVGCLGLKDFHDYEMWLETRGLDPSTLTVPDEPDLTTARTWAIRGVRDELATAVAPGAMARAAEVPDQTPGLWFLAQGDVRNTARLAVEANQRGAEYFLRPGASFEGMLAGEADDEYRFQELIWAASGIFFTREESERYVRGANSLLSVLSGEGQFLVTGDAAPGAALYAITANGGLQTLRAPSADLRSSFSYDAFCAGFMSRYALGLPFEDCLAWGSVMSQFAGEASVDKWHSPSMEQIARRVQAQAAVYSV